MQLVERTLCGRLLSVNVEVTEGKARETHETRKRRNKKTLPLPTPQNLLSETDAESVSLSGISAHRSTERAELELCVSLAQRFIQEDQAKAWPPPLLAWEQLLEHEIRHIRHGERVALPLRTGRDEHR